MNHKQTNISLNDNQLDILNDLDYNAKDNKIYLALNPFTHQSSNIDSRGLAIFDFLIGIAATGNCHKDYKDALDMFFKLYPNQAKQLQQ